MSETPASEPAIGGEGDREVPRPPVPPVPPRPPAPPRPPLSKMDQERISDPERMKALAHPARMAVFDFLGTRRIEGADGATATEIAEVAGMTPSAMSYHLRTLAKAGFIEEAPSRGDARERVWRLRLHSFEISAEPDAPESAHIVEGEMVEAFAKEHERAFERWLRVRREIDPGVKDLSTMASGRFRLKPEELKEFRSRFFELMDEYVQLSNEYTEKGDGDDGTMIFRYMLRLFPNV
ncbi:helix-turn-helix domain-containing protein [Glycomyces sp. NPDC048151]|uniref:helix-turn-helix domain-containing protein n=1 Tax=Glycomyces sp. NPDC048151 TaxID=3364002 RepID=UPI003717DA86